jgi:hypothetical protein
MLRILSLFRHNLPIILQLLLEDDGSASEVVTEGDLR